jgi:hypothetical protein
MPNIVHDLEVEFDLQALKRDVLLKLLVCLA